MGSEKFSLKWNDFQTNVSNSFVQLRNESKLLDVTLVGNDHHQVSAHKLVLSACSDVFRDIFNHNTSSHLVLYLESVDSKEINLMLDYIYQGEVQILQEYLDRFLEIAEKFRLNGLLTDNENLVQDSDSEKVENAEESLIRDMNTYSSIEKSRPPRKNVPEPKIALPSKSIDSANSEVDTKFSELIVREENMYRCTVCERTMKIRSDMSRHLETHLSGLSYECPMCGKSFRSTNSLKNHKSVYHRSQPKF